MNQKYCMIVKRNGREVVKFFSNSIERLEYISSTTYRENDGYSYEIVDNIPEPQGAKHCRSRYPFNLES